MLAQAATCAAKPRHVPATRLRGGYYIFLDSTDPLEQLFGIIRDLHGPGTQVDCIQFEERATAAMSIAAIYSRRPEWQRGSRRLTGSLDHMNPKLLISYVAMYTEKGALITDQHPASLFLN